MQLIEWFKSWFLGRVPALDDTTILLGYAVAKLLVGDGVVAERILIKAAERLAKRLASQAVDGDELLMLFLIEVVSTARSDAGESGEDVTST